MKKTRLVQNATIIVLAVAIIIMSVGYAAYSANLKVTGIATVQAAKWDVHFENVATTANTTIEGENIVKAATISDNKLVVDFACKLALGDVYEFTVDVTNAGTFNAKLDSFSLTGTQDGAAVTVASGTTLYNGAFLKYDATLDGSALANNTALNKGTKKTLKVKVYAVEPANAADLPAADTEFDFTLAMNFIQA